MIINMTPFPIASNLQNETYWNKWSVLKDVYNLIVGFIEIGWTTITNFITIKSGHYLCDVFSVYVVERSL